MSAKQESQNRLFKGTFIDKFIVLKQKQERRWLMHFLALVLNKS
jgi:hypothetical protein